MNCPHSRRRLTLTPNLQHHGREDCEDCGRFIGWAPKPETVARQIENGKRIVVLRNLESLPAWERAFIQSVDGRGPKISPKQQATLDRIYTQYAPGSAVHPA